MRISDWSSDVCSSDLDQLVEAFDQIAGPLADLNIEPVWTSATEQERRTLLDELHDRVAVFPDHLEVQVHGAPRLNLALAEVRLASREPIGGVGGGTRSDVRREGKGGVRKCRYR